MSSGRVWPGGKVLNWEVNHELYGLVAKCLSSRYVVSCMALWQSACLADMS